MRGNFTEEGTFTQILERWKGFIREFRKGKVDQEKENNRFKSMEASDVSENGRVKDLQKLFPPKIMKKLAKKWVK